MSAFADFLAEYFSVWLVAFLISLVPTLLAGRWLTGRKEKPHWSARLLAFAFEALTYLLGLVTILSFIALAWNTV